MRVQRFDIGTLQKPTETSQGYLIVDGLAARVGVQEYLRADGSVRRELRPPEEVFAPASLASYRGASFVEDHPSVAVSPANARKLAVGTVLESGRQDGDFVATKQVITDARVMDLVRSKKKTALSVGYTVDLDETPGTHPVFGRYDAVQRNIVVNHVALVSRGRAGDAARLRLDDMMGMLPGMVRLTSIVDGHQHTFCDDDGRTSYAISSGADVGHDHTVVKGLDGSLTITENAGHSHTVLIDKPIGAPTTQGTMIMDKDELIRSLNEQLKTAEGKLKETQTRADSAVVERDTAKGEIITLKSTIAELTAKVAAGQAASETEAVRLEKVRADEAESKVREFDATFKSALRARAGLERQAFTVMGPEFRMDDMDDRQIMAAVVQRLDSSADVGKDVPDGIIRGRFLSLVEGHGKNVRSQANVAAVLGSVQHETQLRADADTEAKKKAFREQWKAPLPNSSAARAKGVG